MVLPARRMPQQGGQIGQAKFLVFDSFVKMNTKVARQNLAQNQVAWLENLQPISENVLQVVPGPNAALATVTGKTVSRTFPATISGADYDVFFATDGSCTLVNVNTGSQTLIAPAATFSATPDATVFSANILLIMDPTAGYVGWNGTLLAQTGTLSFNIHLLTAGSGYTSNPSVAFSGGHGSGAAASAVASGGVVISVTMTNLGTGYQAGDVVTVTFSGGGASTQATASIVIWPITTGTTLTIFAGRVWWANGRVLNFTGTGASTGQTYDDTNPSDAAGSTTITDADLVHSITALRGLNNFLYIFGDQSIKQIGSITVQSSVTLFTILTLASDIGTSFLQTILSYNRLVLFANKNGVYGIFGATVQKISDDLDGIFQLVDFTQPMCAALNDFHANLGGASGGGGSLHCYCLLLKYNGTIAGVAGPRSIIVVYQTNKWFIVSQGNNLLQIVTVARLSSQQWEIYGSSGSDVTQLVQNNSVGVNIIFQTALTPDKSLMMAKQPLISGIAVTTAAAQNIQMSVDTENSSLVYTFSLSVPVTWINNAGQVVQWQNNSLQNVSFVAGGFVFPYMSTEGYGRYIGHTVTGIALTNMAINSIVTQYQDVDLWGRTP